jgi:hypothetical protein
LLPGPTDSVIKSQYHSLTCHGIHTDANSPDVLMLESRQRSYKHRPTALQARKPLACSSDDADCAFSGIGHSADLFAPIAPSELK